MRAAFLGLLLALQTSVVGAQLAEWVADPAQVPPGTRGVCVTEIDGGERVEIPLTVLGTLQAVAPEAEIVLVRLDDPRFERTGISAGMSGSPVLIDGKLLGALAFAWPFAKEPIAGVTPFARMVGDGASPPASPGGGTGPRPTLTELQQHWRDGTLGEALLAWLVPGQTDGLSPLPLAVAGGGPGGPSGWLAEGFRRLGWVGVPAAVGAGASGQAAADLVPGSMVAGVLVSGDATYAVGGTVTAVRGDQVWAFGHPFLNGGNLVMPLARAGVVAVLPSQMVSFKFFTVGEVRGAFLVDRSHGVWGRLGQVAPTVPVEVVVGGRTFHFQAVRHPVLLPLLVAYLTQSSQAARDRTFGDQTVRVRVASAYAGGLESLLEETVAAGDASAQASAVASALVAFLESSPFPVPTLDRVKVEIDAVEGLQWAEIVDMVPDRVYLRPGEELGVRVRLRPFRGPEVTRQLRVTVPPGLPAGRLDLVVADGVAWSAYDLQMRPLHAGSFADEVRTVARLTPATHLIVALEQASAGVALPGGSMPAPASVVALMQAGLGVNLGATTHRVVARAEETLPYPLLGAQRIVLVVRQDDRPQAGEGRPGEEP